MDHTDYFAGKRVTVMGLGLLGRGVGDAAFIAEAGAAEVLVTDRKSETELAASVEQLRQYENVRFVLGEHREEDFVDRDLVLVAAGVPFDSPYLEAARAAGVPQKQSAALFAELTKIPIIGITGTRGKSTVTHMIHHVLSEVTGEHILLGGNIRGVSNLQLLPDVQEDSLAVMELDSWQLQGWGWAEISPQIAVFTSFMPDHLDYYGRGGRSHEEAMAAYFADKAHIFKHQDEDGVFITTPHVFATAKQYANISLGQEVILADASVIPEETLLAMPGEHNRLNAALAYEALTATSLVDDEIFSALATFPGVPGRLEFMGAIDGVKVYNDNNATEPNATIAGLKAVGRAETKNVVLIAGGADKGAELGQLTEGMQHYCKRVVCLPGTGTDRLRTEYPDLPCAWQKTDGLAEAVAAGLDAAEPGDVLLFSPGFASFGMFKNEYDRNDQFVECIKRYE